jgi:hypothetical protein
MFVNYGHVVIAVLWAFAVYWCYVVVRRLPEDIDEYRQIKEPVRRFAIVFVWCLTAVIAVVLVFATGGIVVLLISGLRELL